MKAILKSNRKVIVDVEPQPCFADCEGKCFYKDRNDLKLYHEDELDWVEYYGG